MLTKNKLEKSFRAEIEQLIALSFKKGEIMCFKDESNSTSFFM